MFPSYSHHHPILCLFTRLRLNIPSHVFQFPTRTKTLKDISVCVREWLSINIYFTNRKTASLQSKVKRNWKFISIYEVELVLFPLVLCQFVSKQKFNKRISQLVWHQAWDIEFIFYFGTAKKRLKIDPKFLSEATKLYLETSWTKVSQKSTKYHRNQSSFSVRFSWSFNLIFVISFACRDLS